MNFGTKIRQRREQLGLSQQDLARLLGMTQSRISEIESGARPHVNLTNLRNLGSATGAARWGPAGLGLRHFSGQVVTVFRSAAGSVKAGAHAFCAPPGGLGLTGSAA